MTPFDFLLNSLASEYGARVIGVVPSGNRRADGSVGLTAVKANGGLAIAQDVVEADYDGMPRSAIATGLVDLVAPVAKIAATLVKRGQGAAFASTPEACVCNIPYRIFCRRSSISCAPKRLTISPVQARHARTLRRAADGDGGDQVRGRLSPFPVSRRRQTRRALVLINVTGFFRDAPVFELLEKKVIPDLVRDHAPDRPLRIWVAGCSSGEESYSLAMRQSLEQDIPKP